MHGDMAFDESSISSLKETAELVTNAFAPLTNEATANSFDFDEADLLDDKAPNLGQSPEQPSFQRG